MDTKRPDTAADPLEPVQGGLAHKREDAGHRTSHDLLEHFFRHESAHVVAMLCRRFGIGQLEAAEDAVQAAMEQAMLRWPRSGQPSRPAAWIHQVAKRLLIDNHRHERVIDRAQAQLLDLHEPQPIDDDWQAHARLPDSLLRMMFVCCHPALDRHSQLALTLKILCGFSVKEIAAGLLLNDEAVKKRLQRGRARLRDLQIELELPADDALPPRLDAIHHALYLMFNEGYSAATADAPVREDVCEEATRLCHLLANHPIATPATSALLALMLCHAARLPSRTDEAGHTVLLEAQNRERWDRTLITHARAWLQHAGIPSSRYHLEAMIALKHCEAASTAATDWRSIATLYTQLLAFNDSPLYRLNRAVALAECGDAHTAIEEIDRLSGSGNLDDYAFLGSVRGRVLETLGRAEDAREAYSQALSQARAPHAQAVLRRHLARLTH